MNQKGLKYHKRCWLPRELCHEFLERFDIGLLILWVHIMNSFFFLKQGLIAFQCCFQSFAWSALSVILYLWDAGRHQLPEAVVPFVFTAPCPVPTRSPLCRWESGEGRQMRWGEADVVRWLSHKTCTIYSIHFILIPLTHASFLHLSCFHIPPSAPLPLSPLPFLPSILPLGAGHWDEEDKMCKAQQTACPGGAKIKLSVCSVRTEGSGEGFEGASQITGYWWANWLPGRQSEENKKLHYVFRPCSRIGLRNVGRVKSWWALGISFKVVPNFP